MNVNLILDQVGSKPLRQRTKIFVDTVLRYSILPPIFIGKIIRIPSSRSIGGIRRHPTVLYSTAIKIVHVC